MHIVCIGDSLTYGYPYDAYQSWPAGITNVLGIDTSNCGINGDTTAGMLGRFEEDVLSLHPSHVVIMGGTNDVFVGEPFEKIKANYLAMLHLLIDKNITPIFALMPPVADSSEENLREIRRFLLEQAKEAHWQVLDFYNIFLTSDGRIKGEYFCDECHPNLAGYERMTKASTEFFQRNVI